MLNTYNTNENVEKITEHLIIFPYHITENHWNLCTIEINIDSSQDL